MLALAKLCRPVKVAGRRLLARLRHKRGEQKVRIKCPSGPRSMRGLLEGRKWGHLCRGVYSQLDPSGAPAIDQNQAAEPAQCELGVGGTSIVDDDRTPPRRPSLKGGYSIGVNFAVYDIDDDCFACSIGRWFLSEALLAR